MIGFAKNLEYKDTTKYGKSIFTTKVFDKDEVVFTACGPVVKIPTTGTIPVDYGLYIDPLPPGSYLNHSCEPTCGVKSRTQIVAMKKLGKGEEITIDYAMLVPRFGDEMTAENRICHCGSNKCRGQLGSYEELPDSLRQQYQGYISDYLTN